MAMQLLPTIRWSFALCLALAGFGTLAHQGQTRGDGAKTVRKEQKDWGIAGDAKALNRTIRVKMTDHMRFSPAHIEVRQGETIRFVLHNDGKLMHEFVIGTQKELDEHAALMVRFPDMEHDEPYMAHVAPGRVGRIVWTFNRPGEFGFACLIAGHYQAGMVGRIRVLPAPRGAATEPGRVGRIELADERRAVSLAAPERATILNLMKEPQP